MEILFFDRGSKTVAFKKLHRLDLEIMKVIWEQGQATVSEVLDLSLIHI